MASRPYAAWGLAVVLCTAAGSARAHSFVGAESCRSCHAFAYEVWSRGPHARAHLSLTEAQLGDARCASCHSNLVAAVGAVGVEHELAVGERDVARDKQSPLLAAAKDQALLGVQCEQCHGPGKLYQPDYVMRDRDLSRLLGLVDATPAGCLACHTEGAPSLEPFDYRTSWARIDHGRAARERWEQARASAAEAAPDPAAVGTPVRPEPVRVAPRAAKAPRGRRP